MSTCFNCADLRCTARSIWPYDACDLWRPMTDVLGTVRGDPKGRSGEDEKGKGGGGQADTDRPAGEKPGGSGG